MKSRPHRRTFETNKTPYFGRGSFHVRIQYGAYSPPCPLVAGLGVHRTITGMVRRLLHEDTPAWVPSVILFAIASWLVASYGVGVLDALKPFLLVALGSFLIAMAITPAVDRLERSGWRRGVATFVIMAGTITVFAAMVGVVGALVAEQLVELAANGPETLRSAIEQVNNTFGTSLDAERLAAEAFADGGAVDDIRDALVDGGRASLVTLGMILPGFLLTFYMAADAPKILHWLCSVTKPERQAEVRRAWGLATEKTGNYVAYRVALTVIGTAYMAALLPAAGVPFWAAATLWFALTNMWVPIIGGALSVALPVALAATQSPTKALVVLGAAMLYQNLIKNMFLAPRLSARAVKLHPAVGFTCVMVGLLLFGPAMALMATPVAATVQAFGSSYMRHHEVV